MRLILRPATGYSSTQAAAVINNNLASLVTALQNYLRSEVPAFNSSVAFASSSPAAPAAPLPPIKATGPAPVSSSASTTTNSAPQPISAGAAIGILLLLVFVCILVAIIVVRLNGSFCGVELCCVPMATCFGAFPLNIRRRKDVTAWVAAAAAPPLAPGARDQHPSTLTTNPLNAALSLRTTTQAAYPGPLNPAPHARPYLGGATGFSV